MGHIWPPGCSFSMARAREDGGRPRGGATLHVPHARHCCVLSCLHVKRTRTKGKSGTSVTPSGRSHAARLLWSTGTASRNVFPEQPSNRGAWPAQTIKGRPTVILALFFHYGSAPAGVLISRLGVPIKRMGTESAEMGAAGTPVSWLLGVALAAHRSDSPSINRH